MKVFYSEEVKKHKIANLPILSLESTILAHGMPYPENYSFAKTTEDICRGLGVAPATIAVLDGDLCVGLSDDQLKRVCTDRNMLKLSKSDLPFALLKNKVAPQQFQLLFGLLIRLVFLFFLLVVLVVSIAGLKTILMFRKTSPLV